MSDIFTQDKKPPKPPLTKPPLPGMPGVAQNFDFLAVKKFSNDNMNVLDSVYSTFSRAVESYLAGLLRLNCAVRLVDIQEKRYTDFHSMLTTNRLMALADVALEGKKQAPAMMYMSANILFVMLDRLMGGPGIMPESTGGGFTDVETAVLEKVYSYIIPCMNEPWQNYCPMVFRYNSLKHNPRLVPGISDDDLAVIVTLKITVQEASGQISICLPSSALETVFMQMEVSHKVTAKQDTAKTRQMIFDSISDSKLELVVRLDDTELSLRDLCTMQVGDVIDLNKPVESDATLYVESVPAFRGELGVHRNKTAIRIKNTIKLK